MNRRAFLTSLVASTTIAACPAAVEAAITAVPTVDWKIWWDKWMADAMDVMVKCWEDQIIFGVSAYIHDDVYPYIHRVDPLTLPAPTKRGGLFND